MMLGAFLLAEPARQEQIARFELKPTLKPTLNEKYPPGTMLLKTVAASICGSDFPGKGGCNCWRRPLDYLNVLADCQICGGSGHELLGTVVEVQGPCRYNVGQRLLGMSTAYIKWIIADEFERLSGHSANVFETPQGGFAQYFISHEAVCLPVPSSPPPSFSWDPRLFVMAQPLATILHGIHHLDNLIGKNIAIIGQGQNGLLWTQMVAGCRPRRLIVLDLLPERLDVAKNYGVTDFIRVDPSVDDKVETDSIISQVADITDNQMCDIVIDAVGHQNKTVDLCTELVRNEGTILLFGLPPGNAEPQFSIRRGGFGKNLRYITASSPTMEDFKFAVELLGEGRFDPSALITHTMPFQRFPEAYDMAQNYKDGIIKVLLTFDDDEA